MDPISYDDDTLSAWLDGELPPAEQAAVAAWLQAHPEAAARLRLWAADRDALRARLAPMAEEPVPERWRDLVLQGSRRRAPRPFPLAWAAGLLLAGGVLGGLIGAGVVWQFPQAGAALQVRLTGMSPAAQPALAWTHRAAAAHAVYAPEVRHPVEVNVAQGDAAEQRAQEQHLARWLSKRLDMPVRLYDLKPQGFELVGGRLLPDATGPSAQLMYQDAAGQRVTLYLRRPEPGSSTAFAYRREGALGMFYWSEEGYGCALVGALPKERLLALAEAVYRQFEVDEAAGTQARAASGPSS